MKKLLVMVLAIVIAMSMFTFASAEEQTTLTFWHRFAAGSNNANILEACCREFEKLNPNVKIEISPQGAEYFDLLQKMIADAAAGNPLPDVFFGGYNLLNYIATELDPVNIEDLAPNKEELDEIIGRFSPEVLSLAAYDGEQIGLPLAMSNMIMYVNMDIFKEAGLTEEDIPTTFEEVFEVCEVIKEKTGRYGFACQLADNWGDQALIFSAGGELLNADKDRVDFTNEGIIRAMQRWQDLYNNGYTPVCNDDELNANFNAGNLAMITTTVMKISTYADYADFDLRMAQTPGFEGFDKQLPAGGAAMICFSEDEAKQDLVFDFMQYMTSKDGMELFTDTGYLCVTTDEVSMIDGQAPAYEQIQYARPWECWPGGSIGLEIDAMWLSTRNAIIMEGKDVVETLTALDEECNMMLENA